MFGRNLDAFWDAVEAGGPGCPGKVKLVFKYANHLEPLRTRDGGHSFLDMLKDIAREATVVNISFE